jgi:hypothetical protein
MSLIRWHQSYGRQGTTVSEQLPLGWLGQEAIRFLEPLNDVLA